MKNYFEILKIVGDPSDTTDGDVRKQFQKLALEHHPDKDKDRTQEDASLQFSLVQEAYENLKDESGRKRHITLLRTQNARSQLPIDNEVDLDDMDWDEAENTFTYPCRCGDGFQITESELELGMDRVQCSSCSFLIHINYKEL